MTSKPNLESECLSEIRSKFNKLMSLNMCNHVNSSDITVVLNELILRLYDLKRRDDGALPSYIQVSQQSIILSRVDNHFSFCRKLSQSHLN